MLISPPYHCHVSCTSCTTDPPLPLLPAGLRWREALQLQLAAQPLPPLLPLTRVRMSHAVSSLLQTQARQEGQPEARQRLHMAARLEGELRIRQGLQPGLRQDSSQGMQGVQSRLRQGTEVRGQGLQPELPPPTQSLRTEFRKAPQRLQLGPGLRIGWGMQGGSSTAGASRGSQGGLLGQVHTGSGRLSQGVHEGGQGAAASSAAEAPQGGANGSHAAVYISPHVAVSSTHAAVSVCPPPLNPPSPGWPAQPDWDMVPGWDMGLAQADEDMRPDWDQLGPLGPDWDMGPDWDQQGVGMRSMGDGWAGYRSTGAQSLSTRQFSHAANNLLPIQCVTDEDPLVLDLRAPLGGTVLLPFKRRLRVLCVVRARFGAKKPHGL